MAKYSVLPRDMKLYSPAEPEGRVFLGGEPWPGDAWSDQVGGDDVGRPTARQALKDLEAADKQAAELRKVIAGQAHDLAQLAKARDDAVSLLAATEQRAADAEAAQKAAEEVAAALTEERDAARQAEASANERAQKLSGQVQELETDTANLKAKLSAFDGDGDGAPGGSKSKTKGL